MSQLVEQLPCGLRMQLQAWQCQARHSPDFLLYHGLIYTKALHNLQEW
jgi:hypothetical protein